MSWYLTTTGTHEAVREAIDHDDHVPHEVAQAVDTILDVFPPGNVTVETSGHLDADADVTSTATIRITTATA